jgi:hypothetical protein
MKMARGGAAKVKPVRHGAPAAADLEGYMTNLRAATTHLKEETRKVYCTQLRRTTEILGQDVQWLLGNSRVATEQLLAAERTDGKKMTDPESAQLLKGLAASVVAVLSHIPGEKERWPEANENWNNLMRHTAQDVVERKYKENTLSSRQEAGFVRWQVVLAKRDEQLRKYPTDPDTLLLAIYTMSQGVGRADYGDMRVYKVPEEKVPARGTPEFAAHPNYIEWSGRAGGWGLRPPTSLRGGHDGVMGMYLNEYKTAKQGKDAEREELTPALTAVIAGSLRASPRAWLFARPRDKGPYTGKEFSNMANGRLRALFGKPLTLQLLRRSLISSLNFNVMTEGEKEAVAAAMNHTLRTQSRYRVATEMAGQEKMRTEVAALCASTCADVVAGKAPPLPQPAATVSVAKARAATASKAKANATAKATAARAKAAAKAKASAARGKAAAKTTTKA